MQASYILTGPLFFCFLCSFQHKKQAMNHFKLFLKGKSDIYITLGNQKTRL